ncbi:MAG: transcriptional regulator [Bacteroidales bacterium]|nr:transcriptional regulator [Bacteroidales bacterium]
MENTQQNWYAAKVFFNRVFVFEEQLAAEGYASYIAVAKVLLKGEDHLRAARMLALPKFTPDRRYIREGALIFERKPLISSLLFFQAAPDELVYIEKMLYGKGFIYKKADGSGPAVIPPRQMASFRLVTSSGDTGLTFFADGPSINIRQGDRVRVLEGPLKGAEGYIKRIKKDRRLLVSIDGVVAVATSYIPQQFLEIVPENQ